MARHTGKSKQQVKSGSPLVSVICLCYNHENFVEEALTSVVGQTYPNIEVIVIDDASTDQSLTSIQHFLAGYQGTHSIKTLFLPENIGNCRAFNQGLALAKGKYVIDFATDDVMLPERINQQVSLFEQLSPDYGVVFSEAAYINEKGQHLYYHYKDKLHRLKKIPNGNIYADLLKRYIVCSPTMIVKKEVLDKMGGYDENLAYEDFDFWVRSSRTHRYAFLNECTTQVRKISGSLSTKVGNPGDKQLYSTFLVCKKALRLNKNKKENKALVKRIQYELRQCIITGNKREAQLFLKLLSKLHRPLNLYSLLYKLTKYDIKFRDTFISVIYNKLISLRG